MLILSESLPETANNQVASCVKSGPLQLSIVLVLFIFITFFPVDSKLQQVQI